ncbi:MAG: large conductance mechanosensitive channel protein MscL [Deltaproteobacteria bacterium]|nr:large conductance mechanosensitive channel protein MscL [Deltaproteobacteria bacterium]
MAKGFREFLLRGNVVELAIAVVIGAAFTGVVTAITSSLLQPLINIFLGGGVSGGKVAWHGQVFDFGAVINAIITFVTIAGVVYYLVVMPMARLMPKKEAPPPAETEAALLAQIRDLLRAQQR